MQGYFINKNIYLFYLAVRRLNNITRPRRPAKPADPRPLITPITLSITEIPIIAPDPKRISVATPRPNTVMIKPDSPLKKPFMYLNTLSIINNNLVNTGPKLGDNLIGTKNLL